MLSKESLILHEDKVISRFLQNCTASFASGRDSDASNLEIHNLQHSFDNLEVYGNGFLLRVKY